MDKNRLENLITGYREQAKPLMDDINARLGGQYPENCLNEIRAMLDHVSRCYRAEDRPIDAAAKEAVCNEELSKAEGHLRRLMYDCFKQLNILLFDAIQQQERRTYSTRWLYIAGGKFWARYTSGLQNAAAQVVEAKKNESYDPDAAMEHYDAAYNAYCGVEQLLVSHRKSLRWSQAVRYFEAVNHWGVWILVTLILSIISSLIGIVI